MTDSLQSMLLGPSALYGAALAAIVLTVAREPLHETGAEPPVRVFLLGVAWQCFHFIEEFATGFQTKLPPFLGLAPWSDTFFVAFNLTWFALWCAAAAGMQARVRIAYFPAWFFAIAMIGNAIWHPLLALATGGYFPGLFTSPPSAVAGVLLLRRLLAVTRSSRESPPSSSGGTYTSAYRAP